MLAIYYFCIFGFIVFITMTYKNDIISKIKIVLDAIMIKKILSL